MSYRTEMSKLAMEATRRGKITSTDCNVLPHGERNTAVVEKVKVPSSRRVLFLAVESGLLHDNTQSHSLDEQSGLGTLNASDPEEYMSGTQLLSIMNMSVNMDVFRQDADNGSCPQAASKAVDEPKEEAFSAFM